MLDLHPIVAGARRPARARRAGHARRGAARGLQVEPAQARAEHGEGDQGAQRLPRSSSSSSSTRSRSGSRGGWRRVALRATGWSLVIVGVLLLVVRRVVGNEIVGSLVNVAVRQDGREARLADRQLAARQRGLGDHLLRRRRRDRGLARRPDASCDRDPPLARSGLRGPARCRRHRRRLPLPPADPLGADAGAPAVVGDPAARGPGRRSASGRCAARRCRSFRTRERRPSGPISAPAGTSCAAARRVAAPSRRLPDALTRTARRPGPRLRGRRSCAVGRGPSARVRHLHLRRRRRHRDGLDAEPAAGRRRRLLQGGRAQALRRRRARQSRGHALDARAPREVRRDQHQLLRVPHAAVLRPLARAGGLHGDERRQQPCAGLRPVGPGADARRAPQGRPRVDGTPRRDRLPAGRRDPRRAPRLRAVPVGAEPHRPSGRAAPRAQGSRERRRRRRHDARRRRGRRAPARDPGDGDLPRRAARQPDRVRARRRERGRRPRRRQRPARAARDGVVQGPADRLQPRQLRRLQGVPPRRARSRRARSSA